MKRKVIISQTSSLGAAKADEWRQRIADFLGLAVDDVLLLPSGVTVLVEYIPDGPPDVAAPVDLPHHLVPTWVDKPAG